MEIRIQCLCIDTADPARIASFWESALGWRRTWEDEDQVCLEPPAGSPEDGIAPDLVFLKVPEGKTVKNRLHLDLRPADQSAEVARLEALGARRVSSRQGDVSWVVMTDPEYLSATPAILLLSGPRRTPEYVQSSSPNRGDAVLAGLSHRTQPVDVTRT